MSHFTGYPVSERLLRNGDLSTLVFGVSGLREGDPAVDSLCPWVADGAAGL